MLVLDGRGPAVLKGTNHTWNTKRPGVASLVMQDDGNLVAYDCSGKSLWATDTFTYANVESLCFQSTMMDRIDQINMMRGVIKMTDEQIALQCIQVLEKYIAKVKTARLQSMNMYSFCGAHISLLWATLPPTPLR